MASLAAHVRTLNCINFLPLSGLQEDGAHSSSSKRGGCRVTGRIERYCLCLSDPSHTGMQLRFSHRRCPYKDLECVAEPVQYRHGFWDNQGNDLF